MKGAPKVFVNELKRRSLKIALAESVTCGMASHLIAAAKGVSEMFAGSVVCYSPEVKTGFLCVKEQTIKKYSCESAQVTEELVRGLKKIFDADVYAALTGLAAKGGSETKSKPVGTVFFCVSYKEKFFSHRKVFRGSPLQVRKKSCLELYAFVLSVVKNKHEVK